MFSSGFEGQSECLQGHRRKMAVESHITQEEIKEMEKSIDGKIVSLLQCAFNNNDGPPPLHGRVLRQEYAVQQTADLHLGGYNLEITG